MNKYNFYKTAFMILINQSMSTKCCFPKTEFFCGRSRAEVVIHIQKHLPPQDQALFKDAIVRGANNPINLGRAASMVLTIVVENARLREEICAPYEAEKKVLHEQACAAQEERNRKYELRSSLIGQIAELRTEEKKMQEAASSEAPVIQVAVLDDVEAPTVKTPLEEIQARIKELNTELDPIKGHWDIEREYTESKKTIQHKLKELEKMHQDNLKKCNEMVGLVRDFERLFQVDMKSFAESKGKHEELARFDPDRYADYDKNLAQAIEQASELDDAA